MLVCKRARLAHRHVYKRPFARTAQFRKLAMELFRDTAVVVVDGVGNAADALLPANAQSSDGARKEPTTRQMLAAFQEGLNRYLHAHQRKKRRAVAVAHRDFESKAARAGTQAEADIQALADKARAAACTEPPPAAASRIPGSPAARARRANQRPCAPAWWWQVAGLQKQRQSAAAHPLTNVEHAAAPASRSAGGHAEPAAGNAAAARASPNC